MYWQFSPTFLFASLVAQIRDELATSGQVGKRLLIKYKSLDEWETKYYVPKWRRLMDRIVDFIIHRIVEK